MSHHDAGRERGATPARSRNPDAPYPVEATPRPHSNTIYPERTIVQVRIKPIAVGGGVHCIAQQQPLPPD